MSIKNDNEIDKTVVGINDVNLENFGAGYVSEDVFDNSLDDQNPFVTKFPKITKEPKHFLQVLREAIDAQIKIIEEEKKAVADKATNQQNENIVEQYNSPLPVNNSESEKNQNSINSDEYSIEGI